MKTLNKSNDFFKSMAIMALYMPIWYIAINISALLINWFVLLDDIARFGETPHLMEWYNKFLEDSNIFNQILLSGFHESGIWGEFLNVLILFISLIIVALPFIGLFHYIAKGYRIFTKWCYITLKKVINKKETLINYIKVFLLYPGALLHMNYIKSLKAK